MEGYSVIGKRVPRIDALAKATGEAKYTDDLTLPRMLIGKLLRSPLPHAKILHIDTSRAKRLVGVKAVVTGQDTPGRKYGSIMKESYMDRYPLAIDKVRFIGEEVAAVAAVDEDTALEALDLIHVDYEELPAVFDPDEAMKPEAPSIHEGKKNAIKSLFLEFGDVSEGFKSADYVREDQFTTQAVAHAPLEPHAALASVDSSGKITLWSSTQSPFILCRDLAQTLNIPKDENSCDQTICWWWIRRKDGDAPPRFLQRLSFDEDWPTCQNCPYPGGGISRDSTAPPCHCPTEDRSQKGWDISGERLLLSYRYRGLYHARTYDSLSHLFFSDHDISDSQY